MNSDSDWSANPTNMKQIIEFSEVWGIAIASLLYCYAIKTMVPKGAIRLALTLPVFCVFVYLPIRIQSIQLRAITAFFLAWMANFKLFLLAFDKGPLFSQSLPVFLALSCFPIDLKNTHKTKSHRVSHTIFVKLIIFIILLVAYRHTDALHPQLILVLYAAHIYLSLEIVLAGGATLAKAILRLDLEPQFNEPYLATSLQDFWGRRWNLAVTRILRTVVFLPTLEIASRILSRRNATIVAVIATFATSGLMHELMFFYLGANPSFELTWFFLIHGICVALEIEVKKRFGGKWKLHGIVSGALALGIVLVTSNWLFWPQCLKAEIDEKLFEEYAAMRDWISSSHSFVSLKL